jgi:hypothetical protein
MKKTLAIFMVLAMATGVALAQDAPAAAAITIGGWGRGVFLPVVNSGADDVDSTADTKSSWNGSPRIGFTVAGNSENVGFQIDLNADGALDTDGTNNFLTYGDQQKIWAKPFTNVKLELGRVYDDTLRGNGTFGVFDWYRPYGTWTGEDLTFDRISTGSYGFAISTTPVTGLFAAISLKDVNGGLTENLFSNAQYAAGYTIDGIGQIRAQYIATYDAAADAGDGDTQGNFQVAFKVTAVENLYADVGFKMNTNSDMEEVGLEGLKTVAVYANYKVAAATIHALANVNMYDDADTKMEFGVGANYDLQDKIGLVADVRYFNDAANDGIDPKTTALVGVTKGFSNGVVGVGVEIMNAADMGFAIPVRMEYWF